MKVIDIFSETGYPPLLVLAAISATLVLMVAFCYSCLLPDYREYWRICVIAAAFILVIFLVGGEKHQLYEVRISDEVSFNEIMKEYDVVEVRDNSYILKRRK